MARMSDAELAKLAKEREALKAKMDKLKASIEKRDEKILKELDRRGTKALETHGVRISKSQNEYVNYDMEALSEALRPAQLRRITVAKVDKKMLAEAVQAGKVDLEVVNAHATLSYSKPWIRVSPRSES